MRYSRIDKTIGDESGIVTIVVLLVLVTLTIAGISAITISNNETSIVRNEQIWASDFYNAETGVNGARINYDDWLTDTFLTADETAASADFDILDDDDNTVANIQARCIEKTATPVFGGNVADDIPAISHTSPPPDGSGYSTKYFETRRYSITATCANGTSIVQTGVWKIFNKY